MRQFYGSYSDTNSHQANPITASDGNTNYIPKELLPVSTAGEVASGKLQFVQGIVTNGETTKLTEITACSETDLTKTATISTRQDNNKNHPYMVFDMYLRNISAKTSGQDDLKLNAGSKVYINTVTTDDAEQEGKGRFVSAIAVVFPSGKEFVVRGTCEGMIGFEEKGKNGFGYDPLFIVDNYNKTFGELPSTIKNTISHRANSLKLMEEEFNKRIVK